MGCKSPAALAARPCTGCRGLGTVRRPLRRGERDPAFLVLPRHVFMPFQTALAVSRSLQALGLARTFGPVRGSSWGGAEAGERLPVRCLRHAGPFCFAILASQNAQSGRHGHPCDACVAPPRVTSRPLGGRHVVRAADLICRSANRRKGQDDAHMCRRRPCFTAHAAPPWLACAELSQRAHTGGSLASVLVPTSADGARRTPTAHRPAVVASGLSRTAGMLHAARFVHDATQTVRIAAARAFA